MLNIAKLKDKLRPYLFLFPAFGTMALLTFYPVSYGFYVSLTDMTRLKFFSETWKFIGLSNFVKTFQLPEFWKVFGRTVIWTVTCVLLHVTMGLLLALLLNRQTKLGGLYRTIYLLPWAIPAYISCMVWRGMYNPLPEYGLINKIIGLFGFSPINWLNTMPWAFMAVIIANIWLGIPFMMMIFSAALQKIPVELYDAADVDGATGWQKFRFITLPLLKPIAVTASLLGFIWTFNLFNVIYLITGGGPAKQTHILVTYVFDLFNHYPFDWGMAAAISVVIFFILLTISIVYLKITKAVEAWY